MGFVRLKIAELQSFVKSKLPDKDIGHFSSAVDLCWKHILFFRRDHLQSNPDDDASNLLPIFVCNVDTVFWLFPSILRKITRLENTI